VTALEELQDSRKFSYRQAVPKILRCKAKTITIDWMCEEKSVEEKMYVCVCVGVCVSVSVAVSVFVYVSVSVSVYVSVFVSVSVRCYLFLSVDLNSQKYKRNESQLWIPCCHMVRAIKNNTAHKSIPQELDRRFPTPLTGCVKQKRGGKMCVYVFVSVSVYVSVSVSVSVSVCVSVSVFVFVSVPVCVPVFMSVHCYMFRKNGKCPGPRTVLNIALSMFRNHPSKFKKSCQPWAPTVQL
jgi:hypothetical protein